jgi:hypothetical protein
LGCGRPRDGSPSDEFCSEACQVTWTARQATARAPSGRSSIYLGTDGYWHGQVTMGLKDNGKPDRRHIMRKGNGAYDALQQLEEERKQGTVRAPGSKSQTVADWLTHWLDNIAAPNVWYKTEEGYRTDIHKHLIPRIGAHKMAKIQHEPERFEKVYIDLAKLGYSQHTVHHVHITVVATGMRLRHGGGAYVLLASPPFCLVRHCGGGGI